jgi:hypothetical protein
MLAKKISQRHFFDLVMQNVFDLVMQNVFDLVMQNVFDLVMQNVFDLVMQNVFDLVMQNVSKTLQLYLKLTILKTTKGSDILGYQNVSQENKPKTFCNIKGETSNQTQRYSSIVKETTKTPSVISNIYLYINFHSLIDTIILSTLNISLFPVI